MKNRNLIAGIRDKVHDSYKICLDENTGLEIFTFDSEENGVNTKN